MCLVLCVLSFVAGFLVAMAMLVRTPYRESGDTKI